MNSAHWLSLCDAFREIRWFSQSSSTGKFFLNFLCQIERRFAKLNTTSNRTIDKPFSCLEPTTVISKGSIRNFFHAMFLLVCFEISFLFSLDLNVRCTFFLFFFFSNRNYPNIFGSNDICAYYRVARVNARVFVRAIWQTQYKWTGLKENENLPTTRQESSCH